MCYHPLKKLYSWYMHRHYSPVTKCSLKSPAQYPEEEEEEKSGRGGGTQLFQSEKN